MFGERTVWAVSRGSEQVKKTKNSSSIGSTSAQRSSDLKGFSNYSKVTNTSGESDGAKYSLHYSVSIWKSCEKVRMWRIDESNKLSSCSCIASNQKSTLLLRTYYSSHRPFFCPTGQTSAHPFPSLTINLNLRWRGSCYWNFISLSLKRLTNGRPTLWSVLHHWYISISKKRTKYRRVWNNNVTHLDQSIESKWIIN